MSFQIEMPVLFEPNKRPPVASGNCVFPILDGSSDPKRFCGSGFFVDGPNGQLLVTAAHVVKECEQPMIATPPEWKAGEPLLQNVEAQEWHASVVKSAAGVDLAILEVQGFSCRNLFAIDTHFSHANVPLLCIELSRSSTARQRIVHSTRMGNLVRLVNDSLFPADSLELSFAALKGASGAPVFYVQDNRLMACGIIKSNAAYESLPVEQYEVIDESDGGLIRETTKFYLPQAIAVHAKHLSRLVETA